MVRMAARLLFALLPLGCAVPAIAQSTAPPPTTAVLVSLTIKPDVDRAQVMKVMPDEVRATLKLYLDGKIQQWYSKADGRGVVFFVNAKSAEEAAGILSQLPLIKDGIAQFEYTPLAPLSPLRYLMDPSTK